MCFQNNFLVYLLFPLIFTLHSVSVKMPSGPSSVGPPGRIFNKTAFNTFPNAILMSAFLLFAFPLHLMSQLPRIKLYDA